MNELADQSSSRNGATVLWVTIHTAEGPTDEFPADAGKDAGSADALLAFFEGKTDRSCHAIADDDKLLDNLVPYDRAAWTLRNGNRYSDNLEMCGLASWSATEWMRHTGMLDEAARWVADRCKARGIPPVRLTIAQVAARSARGYIDHNTYTQASGDGTHWDVGPNFPWPYFGSRVTAFYNGTDITGDDMSAADVQAINEHTDAQVAELLRVLGANLGESAVNNPRAWLNAGIAARLSANDRANLAPLLDDEAKLREVVGDIPPGLTVEDIKAALRVVLAEPAGA